MEKSQKWGFYEKRKTIREINLNIKSSKTLSKQIRGGRRSQLQWGERTYLYPRKSGRPYFLLPSKRGGTSSTAPPYHIPCLASPTIMTALLEILILPFLHETNTFSYMYLPVLDFKSLNHLNYSQLWYSIKILINFRQSNS